MQVVVMDSAEIMRKLADIEALSGPRMEPASSALEGGFLTTGPPGKSQGKPFI